MHTDEEINRITEIVIGCAFRVGNALGYGYLEKVYENALAHEMRKAGLEVAQQFRIPVIYDGVQVGDYCCDMLINGFLLIEAKTGKGLDEAHVAQCLNYLKATSLTICLLINFGPKVELKRLRR